MAVQPFRPPDASQTGWLRNSQHVLNMEGLELTPASTPYENGHAAQKRQDRRRLGYYQQSDIITVTTRVADLISDAARRKGRPLRLAGKEPRNGVSSVIVQDCEGG